MTLWWIGIGVLVVVVLPVVIGILLQVLIPIFKIRAYAEDILEYGALLPVHLEATSELLKTRDLVKVAGGELGRYARAIDNL
jgi:hypothetical protein